MASGYQPTTDSTVSAPVLMVLLSAAAVSAQRSGELWQPETGLKGVALKLPVHCSEASLESALDSFPVNSQTLSLPLRPAFTLPVFSLVGPLKFLRL